MVDLHKKQVYAMADKYEKITSRKDISSFICNAVGKFERGELKPIDY